MDTKEKVGTRFIGSYQRVLFSGRAWNGDKDIPDPGIEISLSSLNI